MNQWIAVDRYIEQSLLDEDEALKQALQSSDQAGLPQIAVSPAQGKLLQILAVTCRAKLILEIGTLGGYSTIWLGRALPTGGRLISLEADQKHADVARANIERAGLSSVVEVRVGQALELLPTLAAEGSGPFDLTFIDADKRNTAEYFDWAVRLSRPGSFVITDNVVRDGKVVESDSEDDRVQGVRRLISAMGSDPRVTATVIQTVGVKGYDGLAIAVVK